MAASTNSYTGGNGKMKRMLEPSIKLIGHRMSGWLGSDFRCKPPFRKCFEMCERCNCRRLEHYNFGFDDVLFGFLEENTWEFESGISACFTPFHLCSRFLGGLLHRIPCHHIPNRPLLSLTLQASGSLLLILPTSPPPTLLLLHSPLSLILRYLYLILLLVVAPLDGTRILSFQHSRPKVIPLGYNKLVLHL